MISSTPAIVRTRITKPQIHMISRTVFSPIRRRSAWSSISHGNTFSMGFVPNHLSKNREFHLRSLTNTTFSLNQFRAVEVLSMSLLHIVEGHCFAIESVTEASSSTSSPINPTLQSSNLSTASLEKQAAKPGSNRQQREL